MEASRTGVKGSRRALRARPYAVRKRKQYAVSAPGDLVQGDSMDLRPVPGVVFCLIRSHIPSQKRVAKRLICCCKLSDE